MEKANTGWSKTSAVKTADTDLTERIRRKAREIWEKKGRAQGKDLEYWLEAEKLVKSGKA